jgi:hypothetical protein
LALDIRPFRPRSHFWKSRSGYFGSGLTDKQCLISAK